MNVTIRFDSGPPTRLENHPSLACKVALLGTPTRVWRLGSARFRAEWDLPGRLESATFGNPWPLDRRDVTGLEVEPEAFEAVRGWIADLHEDARRDYFEAGKRMGALLGALVTATRKARPEMMARPVEKCGVFGCSFCDSENS